MPVRPYYTAADVLAMPEDGNKYEVVHGELLVSPGPRLLHQLVVFRLVELIGSYLRQHPVGAGFAGGNVSWSEETLVIPDLLVADLTEARTRNFVRTARLWGIVFSANMTGCLVAAALLVFG